MFKGLWKKIDHYRLGIPSIILGLYLSILGSEKILKMNILGNLTNSGISTANSYYFGKDINVQDLKTILKNPKSIENIESLINKTIQLDQELGGELYIDEDVLAPFEIPGKEQEYLKKLQHPSDAELVTLTNLILKDYYYLTDEYVHQYNDHFYAETLKKIHFNLKVLQNPAEDTRNQTAAYEYLKNLNEKVFKSGYTSPNMYEKMRWQYTHKPKGKFFADFHTHRNNSHRGRKNRFDVDLHFNYKYPEIVIEPREDGFDLYPMFRGKMTKVSYDY